MKSRNGLCLVNAWILVLALGCSTSAGPGVSTSDAGNDEPTSSETPAVADSSIEAHAVAESSTESGVPNGGRDAGTDASSEPEASLPVAVNGCPPSWTTTPNCGGTSSPPGPAPEFGPHVLIFDPSMPMDTIQSQLNMVDGKMDPDQFDNNGYAYFFKPGQYALDVRVGFYMHVIGLGQSPDDVVITGAVRSKAYLPNGNATCNFWRTVENLAVVPTQAIDNGTDVWAVSQGTSMRRTHIQGSIVLVDSQFPGQNWGSGGFIADSKIDAQINSGVQQQFLTRNDDLTSWVGSNWNMVFVGDDQAPVATWPSPPYTVVASTPVVREKPFLFIDGSGNYFVMVPNLKSSSSGSSWASGAPPGAAVSIDRFYVAQPGADTAETMNAALSQGKHLLLTPGDYRLDGPIQVTLPNTIVLGIGLPVLTPTGGNSLLTIADVDGVSVAGLLIEAGPMTTPTLLEAGPMGSTADHAKNPTVLFDVNCRIGGNIVGTASSCFTINSNDVIIENSWLWRADHGAGAAWNTNRSNSGIIVNGDNVTAYGLFVEHHEQFQTLWNGNNGSVYFYQSEMPYDPPSQSQWMEGPGVNGYPSYKVADGVVTHHGTGIGIYSFFQSDVHADNAIETPSNTGIVMTHMMTYGSGTGGIDNIINGGGGHSSGTAYSSN
jgi:hypothetical protein